MYQQRCSLHSTVERFQGFSPSCSHVDVQFQFLSLPGNASLCRIVQLRRIPGIALLLLVVDDIFFSIEALRTHEMRRIEDGQIDAEDNVRRSIADGLLWKQI